MRAQSRREDSSLEGVNHVAVHPYEKYLQGVKVKEKAKKEVREIPVRC